MDGSGFIGPATQKIAWDSIWGRLSPPDREGNT
jgi:hypothetical protein